MKLCICLAEQTDGDNAVDETTHNTDALSNTDDPATASAQSSLALKLTAPIDRLVRHTARCFVHNVSIALRQKKAEEARAALELESSERPRPSPKAAKGVRIVPACPQRTEGDVANLFQSALFCPE